eukprot:31365-Pelagococcus_subviridis.AAC.11
MNIVCVVAGSTGASPASASRDGGGGGELDRDDDRDDGGDDGARARMIGGSRLTASLARSTAFAAFVFASFTRSRLSSIIARALASA